LLANPRDFDVTLSIAATNLGRENAGLGYGRWKQWVKICGQNGLAPKGQAHFIHRAERYADSYPRLYLHFWIWAVIESAARFAPRIGTGLGPEAGDLTGAPGKNAGGVGAIFVWGIFAPPRLR